MWFHKKKKKNQVSRASLLGIFCSAPPLSKQPPGGSGLPLKWYSTQTLPSQCQTSYANTPLAWAVAVKGLFVVWSSALSPSVWSAAVITISSNSGKVSRWKNESDSLQKIDKWFLNRELLLNCPSVCSKHKHLQIPQQNFQHPRDILIFKGIVWFWVINISCCLAED